MRKHKNLVKTEYNYHICNTVILMYYAVPAMIGIKDAHLDFKNSMLSTYFLTTKLFSS